MQPDWEVFAMNAKSKLKVIYAESVIEVNTTFARMMQNPLSDEYALLQKTRTENPTFAVHRRQIKRNGKKETYAGLTYAYMRAYIEAHASKETVERELAEFDELVLISKCHGRSLRYPTIKKWFLAKYPEVAKFGVEPKAEDKPQSQNVLPLNTMEAAETGAATLKESA